MSQIILGIETSCDDTSLAIIETDSKGEKLNLLFLKSFSQEEYFKKWGGVVPELASREHVKTIPLLLQDALDQTNIKLSQIDQIAITTHPGLLGPLLTGLNAAKTLCMMLKIPLIPVHHLLAHLEVIHLEQKISYPYLGLIISGGHTLIVKVTNPSEMEILGNTIDDAAGETFDKSGKMLGLGYPAGKLIDELARNGDKEKFKFPISVMKDRPGKISYSGMKTSLRVLIEKEPDLLKNNLSDLCASFQEAIVQTLELKLMEVLKQDPMLHSLQMVVGGGVACNSRLREVFQKNHPQVYFVSPKYCTDNAAMICVYGAKNQQAAIKFPDCLNLDAKARAVNKI